MQLEFTEQGSSQILSVLDEITKGLESISKPRRPIALNVQSASGIDQQLGKIQTRLGDIGQSKTEVGLKFDSSASQQIDSITQKTSKMQSGMQSFAKQMSSTNVQLGQMAGKTGQAVTEQEKFVRSIDTTARTLDVAAKKISGMDSSLASTQRSTSDASASITSLAGTLSSLMSGLNSTSGALPGVWKGLKEIEITSRAAYKMTDMFGRSAKSMERIAYITPYLTDLASQFVVLPKEITNASNSMSRFMLKISKEARGIDEMSKGLADVHEEFLRVEGTADNLKRAISFKDGFEGLTKLPQLIQTLGQTTLAADKKFSKLEKSISSITGRSVDLRGALGKLSPQYKLLSIGFKVFDRTRSSINLLQKASIGLAVVAPQSFSKLSKGMLSVLNISKTTGSGIRASFSGIAGDINKAGGLAGISFQKSFVEIQRTADSALKGVQQSADRSLGSLAEHLEAGGKALVKFTPKTSPGASAGRKAAASAVDTGSTLVGKSMLFNAKQTDRFRTGLLGATDDAIGFKDRLVELSDAGIAMSNMMAASPIPLLSAGLKLLQGDTEGAGKTLLAFGKKILVTQISSRGLKAAFKLLADSSARTAVIEKVKSYIEGAGISMDRVKTTFTTAWTSIKSVTTSAGKSVQNVFGMLTKKLEGTSAGKKVIDMMKALSGTLSMIGGIVKGVFSGMMDDAEKSSGVFGKVAKGFNLIKKAATDAKEAAKGKYDDLTKGFKQQTSTEAGAATKATETGRKKESIPEYRSTKTITQKDVDTAKARLQKDSQAGKQSSQIDTDIAGAEVGKEKTLSTKSLSDVKRMYKYGYSKAKQVIPEEPPAETAKAKGMKIPGLEQASTMFASMKKSIQDVVSLITTKFIAAVEAVTGRIKELGRVAFGESVFPDMGKWIEFVIKKLSGLKDIVSNTVSSLKGMVFPEATDKKKKKDHEKVLDDNPDLAKDLADARSKAWSAVGDGVTFQDPGLKSKKEGTKPQKTPSKELVGDAENTLKKTAAEAKKAGEAIGSEIDKGSKKASKGLEDFAKVAYKGSVLPDTGDEAKKAGTAIGDEIGKGSNSAIAMLKRLPDFIKNLPSTALEFAKKFIPKFVWDIKDLIPLDTLRQAVTQMKTVLEEATPEPMKGFAGSVKDRLAKEAKAARLVKAPVVGMYKLGKKSIGNVAGVVGRGAARAAEEILGFDIAEPFRAAGRAAKDLRDKTVEIGTAIQNVDYAKLGSEMAEAVKTMDVKRAATAMQTAFQHIDIVTPIKDAAKALREFDYIDTVKSSFTAFGNTVVGAKDAMIGMKDGAKMSWFTIKTLVTQGPKGFGKMLREGANIERTIQSMGDKADTLRAKIEKSNPELSMMGRLWKKINNVQEKLIPGLAEAKQQPGLMKQAGSGVKGFIKRDWDKTKQEVGGVGRSLREVGLRGTLSKGKERLSDWWTSPISGKDAQQSQLPTDFTKTKRGEYLGKASKKLQERAALAKEKEGFFGGLKAKAYEKLAKRVDPAEIQWRKQAKIAAQIDTSSDRWSPKQLITGKGGVAMIGGALGAMGGIAGAAIGTIGLGGSVVAGGIAGAIGGGLAGYRIGGNAGADKFKPGEEGIEHREKANRYDRQQKLQRKYTVGGAIAGGIAGAGLGLALPGILATGGAVGALGGGVRGFSDKDKVEFLDSYSEKRAEKKTLKERVMSAGIGAAGGGLIGLLGGGAIAGVGALGGVGGGAAKGALGGGGIGALATDAGSLFFKKIGDGFRQTGASILKAFPEIKAGAIAAGSAMAPGTIGATLGTFQRKVKGAGSEGLTKERADEISKSLKESAMGEKLGGMVGKLPQAIAGINTSINKFMSTSVGAASAGGVDKLIDLGKLPGKAMSTPGRSVGAAAKSFSDQGSVVNQFKASKKILQESGMYTDTLRDKIRLIGDSWKAVDVRSRVVGNTFKAILTPVRMLKGGATDFEKALDNISPVAGTFYTTMTATNTVLQKLTVGAEKLAKLPEARIFQVKNSKEALGVLGSYAVKAAEMGSKAIRDKFDSALTGNEQKAKTTSGRIGGFFRNIATSIAHPQKAMGDFIRQDLALERTVKNIDGASGGLKGKLASVMTGPSATPVAAYVAKKTVFKDAPKKGAGSLMYKFEQAHADNPMLSGIFKTGKRAAQAFSLPGLKGLKQTGLSLGVGTAVGAGVGALAGGLPGAAVGASIGSKVGGVAAGGLAYYRRAKIYQAAEKAGAFANSKEGGLAGKAISLAAKSFKMPSPLLGGVVKEAAKGQGVVTQFKDSYKILGELSTYTDSWGGKLRQAYDAMKAVNVASSIAGSLMAPLAGKAGSFSNEFVKLNPSMGAVVVSLKAASGVMSGLRAVTTGVQTGITGINTILNRTFKTDKIDISLPFKRFKTVAENSLSTVETKFKAGWEFIKKDAGQTVQHIGNAWDRLADAPGIKRLFGKQMKTASAGVRAYASNISSPSPMKWSDVKKGTQASSQMAGVFTTAKKAAKDTGAAIGTAIKDGADKATKAVQHFGDVNHGNSVMPDAGKAAKKTGKDIGESIPAGAMKAVRAIKQFGSAAKPGTFKFTTSIIEGFQQASREIETAKTKMTELQAKYGEDASGRRDYKTAERKVETGEKAKRAIVGQLAATPGGYATFRQDVQERKKDIHAQRQRGELTESQKRAQIGDIQSVYREVGSGVGAINEDELKRRAPLPGDAGKTQPRPNADSKSNQKQLLSGVRSELTLTAKDISALNTAQKRLVKTGQEATDKEGGKGTFTQKLTEIEQSSDRLKKKWEGLSVAQEQLSGRTDQTKTGIESLFTQIKTRGGKAQSGADAKAQAQAEKEKPISYKDSLLEAVAERKSALRKLRGEQRGLVTKGEKRTDAAQGEGAFASSMVQIGASSKNIMGDLSMLDAQLKKVGITSGATSKKELNLAQAIEATSQKALDSSKASSKQEQAAIKQQLGIQSFTNTLKTMATTFGSTVGSIVTDSDGAAKKTDGFGKVVANAAHFFMLYSQRGGVMAAVTGVIGNEFLGTSSYAGMFAKGLGLIFNEVSKGTGLFGAFSGVIQLARGKTENLSEGMQMVAEGGRALFSGLAKATTTAVGFQTAVVNAAGGSETLVGGIASIHPAAAGVVVAFTAWKVAGKQIVAMMRDILGVGGKVQTQLLRTQGLLTASGSESFFPELKQQVYDLGASTEHTTTQVAQATNALLQLGFSGQEAKDSLKAVIDAASANQIPLEQAAQAAANTMRQFGLDSGDAAKDASDALGALSAIAFNTGADITSLQMAMRNVGTTAKTLGMSVGETASALGVFGNVAIRYGKAGTQLNTILTRMAAPPSTAKKAFKELGIELFDGEGKFRKFSDIIDDVSGAFKGMGDAQKASYAKMIAGQRGLVGFLTLTDTGKDKLDELNKKTKTGAEINKKMAEEFRAGWEGSVAALSSAIEGVKITAFEIMGKSATKLVRILVSLVAGFNTALRAFENFITPFLDLTIEAVETIVDFKKVALGAALINPFPAAIKSSGLLLDVLGKIGPRTAAVTNAFKNMGQSIGASLGKQRFTGVSSAFAGIRSGIGRGASAVGDFAKGIPGAGKVSAGFASMGKAATRAFQPVIKMLGKFGFKMGSFAGLGKLLGKLAPILQIISLIVMVWSEFKDEILNVVKVLQIGFQVIDIGFKLLIKLLKLAYTMFTKFIGEKTGWNFDISGSLDRTIKTLGDVQKAIDSWTLADFEKKMTVMVGRVVVAAIRGIGSVILAAENTKASDLGTDGKPKKKSIASKIGGYVTGGGILGKMGKNWLVGKGSEKIYGVADDMERGLDMIADDDTGDNTYGDVASKRAELEAERMKQVLAMHEREVQGIQDSYKDRKFNRQSTVSLYMQWLEAEVGSEKWTELENELNKRSGKVENTMAAYYIEQGAAVQKVAEQFAGQGFTIPKDASSMQQLAKALKEKRDSGEEISISDLAGSGFKIPSNDAIQTEFVGEFKDLFTDIKKAEENGVELSSDILKSSDVPVELREKVMEFLKSTKIEDINVDSLTELGIKPQSAQDMVAGLLEGLSEMEVVGYDKWITLNPNIHLSKERAASIKDSIVGLEEAKKDRERELVEAKSTWSLMLELEHVDLNSDAAYQIFTELELRKERGEFDEELGGFSKELQEEYDKRLEDIRAVADEQRVRTRDRAKQKLQARTSVDIAVAMEGMDPGSVEFEKAASELMERGPGEMEKAQEAAQRVFEIDMQVKGLEDVKKVDDATLSLSNAVLAVRDKMDAIGKIDLAAKLKVEGIALKVKQFLIEPFDHFKDKLGEIKSKFADMIQGIQNKRVDIKEKLGLYGSETEQKKLFGLQQKLRDTKSKEGKEGIKKKIDKQREKMGIPEEANKERFNVLSQREGVMRQELALAGTAEKKAGIGQKLSDLLFQKSEYAPSAEEAKMFGQDALLVTQQSEQFALSAQRKAVEKEKLQQESDLKQKGILTSKLSEAESPEAKASILEKLIPIVEKGGQLGTASEMVKYNEDLTQAVVKKAEEQVNREKEALEIQKQALEIQKLQLEKLGLIYSKGEEVAKQAGKAKPSRYADKRIIMENGVFTNMYD